MRGFPGAGASGSACLALLLLLAACELDEITVVQVEPVAVAEVYVNLGADPSTNQILGFLHQTVGSEDVDSVTAALVASRLTVTRADGLRIPLLGAGTDQCLEEGPADYPAACFLAQRADAALVGPRDLLEVEVRLADGGLLEGATRVPGSFELVGVTSPCELPPDRLMPLEWSRSEGAWAYVNEAAMVGLSDALRFEGIDLDIDPLYLLGLSISDSDTTIVFPSEFGVFNRFDLDQDVAVRLQRGLPVGVTSEVTITAVDRNYVNWSRGGNFNPSGQVRVPSLRGDGIGVFGSTVGRRIVVAVPPEPGSAAACPTVE